MAQPSLTGGCQCGHVRYSSLVLPDQLVNCHCHTCRKLCGAPFLTFAGFPINAITWTSGSDSMKRKQYSEIADRTHCAECGSPISMAYKSEPDRIWLTAGSIDEKSVKGVLPKAKMHIFVEDGMKAGWYDLPVDGLKRYSQFSSSPPIGLDDSVGIPPAPGRC